MAEFRPLAASPFVRMRDEEVVALARAGSVAATEHLLCRYRFLVQTKVRVYYLVGAEREDLAQEGMIGLYKAIRDFSSQGLSAFRSFAELCITRQIITAVKAGTRHKQHFFAQCVTLDGPVAGDQPGDLGETLADPGALDPEQAMLVRGCCEEIARSLRGRLSDFEARVLLGHLQGMSYRGISDQLGCQVKQIDNALQRSKKKLSESLDDRQLASSGRSGPA